MSEENNNEPTETSQGENNESNEISEISESDAPAKKKTSRRPTKKSTKKTTKKKTTRKKTTKAKVSETTEPVAEGDAELPVTDETPATTPQDEESSPETNDQGDDDIGSDESEPVKKKTSRRKKTTKKTTTKVASKEPATKQPKSSTKQGRVPVLEMIVNYSPGEECRIAMLEDGKLEEFSVEPTNQVSRVGNIYVGRVTNIEPAIQAAFVDFGMEENGFLHVSDLHPKYFAKGDDKTEQVGKKTPRKSRPPIQDCLKRGQEITVQVLKEGVGTKGPSLTSYLSIPGRFLVMMPGMDKVGVSRKEEDDDKRRAAREILSHLELPEGFGFILRTAGFDRTKMELKRDLAYLHRLWKDMEKRRKGGSRSKTKLLYTESDLLMRSIRDLMTSEVSRVVIDSESALNRVANFLKIAAPRSGTKLAHYVGTRPIFHAFEIEPQIEEIHSREVHLPSGGRLVIDQTEALVAIDVNSGKSRGARDAETNAYKTNLEAVDAICRQLRLRDLGGLVVNDLIDMRFQSHRKDIEQRFRERLKRDRAKSTIAPISPFGLLEMTRQRMRGSMESLHFSDCPMCHGRGLVQRPDSVAASALRDLAALIDYPQVRRAELVVNSRVASSLLSTMRKSLTRIELSSGKIVDVRVSDTLAIDRFSFYAYDAHGADISIERLKPNRAKSEPSVVDWLDKPGIDGSWAIDPLDEADETTAQSILEKLAKAQEESKTHESSAESIGQHDDDDDDSGDGTKKKRRRRRRGRRSGRSEDSEQTTETRSDESEGADETVETNDSSSENNGDESEEGTTKKRRRRRRGGRGRSGSSENQGEDSGESTTDGDSARQESRPEPTASTASGGGEMKKGGKPRRRPLKPGSAAVASESKPEPRKNRERAPEREPTSEKKKPAPRKRSASKPVAAKTSEPTPEPKPARKGLYSNARRKLSASEIAKLGIES
ncbi:MAG: Rne/Rng family ribonuclease [Phycisphaerales bacterium]|nr:Rne/Rng family ribonuclease [Phycisphaerales bacterium]